MDINRCTTLSEFAYNVWSLTCNTLNHIYVPHTGKEENDDRAAYYGGRVTPQRKQYISKDYVEGETQYDYDKIEDFLIYPDVNSLYPTVCKEFAYATGYWRYYTAEVCAEHGIKEILNGHSPDLSTLGLIHEARPIIARMCCRVNVKCPKNIITPFLVERNADGVLIHSLDDKVDQWYWGCELEEAVKIGYLITEVHEIKCFDYAVHIFGSFVDTCWKGREKYPKSKTDPVSNARNLAYKMTLNTLTGKFGQKSHKTNTRIYNSGAKYNEKMEKNMISCLENLDDFDIFFSDDGENATVLMEVTNPKPHPTYPIYLSAQILAYSRVYMSRIYRLLDAYRSPDHAIYYTDTDSLVLHARCLPILEQAGLIGSGLGQLSCGM